MTGLLDETQTFDENPPYWYMLKQIDIAMSEVNPVVGPSHFDACIIASERSALLLDQGELSISEWAWLNNNLLVYADKVGYSEQIYPENNNPKDTARIYGFRGLAQYTRHTLFTKYIEVNDAGYTRLIDEVEREEGYKAPPYYNNLREILESRPRMEANDRYLFSLNSGLLSLLISGGLTADEYTILAAQYSFICVQRAAHHLAKIQGGNTREECDDSLYWADVLQGASAENIARVAILTGRDRQN